MRHVLVGPPLTIPEDRPARRESEVVVEGLTGVLRSVRVVLQIEHSAPQDLDIKLAAPGGQTVKLSRRTGLGSRRFGTTELTFDDKAPQSILGARGWQSAAYKPMEELKVLSGSSYLGVWKLVIDDLVAGEGGFLTSWRLELETTKGEFSIELDVGGGITTSQRGLLEAAAIRWSDVIIGDLPEATLPNGRKVDDIIIFASGEAIDGVGSVLGQAGPTHLRWESSLPIAGIMEFDIADLANMEDSGLLEAVFLHEMGHVLGIGTLWDHFLKDKHTTDPKFSGLRASSEYGALLGSGFAHVPVEATGGPGTALGHFRESTFDNELMTGWIDRGRNPMSRVTVGALADLEYQVNIAAADDYTFQRGLRMPGAPGKPCRMVHIKPEHVK